MTHGMILAATNGGERRENDFYPTPPEPTLALIPKLQHFPRTIWEPACGDGGIAKPLERNGFRVVGTDLVDRGYGQGGLDFLAERTRRADALITNPPFGKLVTAFIKHALDLDVPYIAMLLNVNLWHAAGRNKLWNRRVPEAVYALCWRPDFTGSGSPYFNCIWTVWGPKSATVTRYERLSQPAEVPALVDLSRVRHELAMGCEISALQTRLASLQTHAGAQWRSETRKTASAAVEVVLRVPVIPPPPY